MISKSGCLANTVLLKRWLPEAKANYREILARKPGNAKLLHLSARSSNGAAFPAARIKERL